MTALRTFQRTIFDFLKPSEPAHTALSASDLADMRREYVMSWVNSGSCMGEFGVMALMQASPKDL